MSTAINLLQQAASEFSGDVVNRVSSALGESNTATQSALSGVLPALLGGLVNKASTTQGAGDLLDLIRKNRFDSAQAVSAAGAVTSPDGISRLIETGGSLLDTVLGPRSGSVIEWISSLSGIKRTSSSSLLSLALPVILSLVGRQSGGNASSLMSLLSAQKNYLRDAPAGLASALGFGSDWEAAPRAAPVAAAAAYDTDPVRGGTAWWKWALPLLALLALGWYFLTRQEETPAVAVATPTATITVATPTATIAPSTVATPGLRADLGAFIERNLPDGTTLRIPSNGVESRLIAFIEDSSRAVDRTTWFSFDRLEFETGSARLRPSSEEQLRNVAAILKAYPNVNLKIGGYTDNEGDEAANMKLSSDRATNTMNEIVRNGIDRTRLEAEGYGEQHPVADNATAEGRQRNRRIDIRVTKK
jgi:outer membrane protein OmpA-like peptidoglycan-associated protein